MNLSIKSIFNKDNIYWTIIIVISIISGFLLKIIGHDINQIPIVFSSISTGLAAIFALVFALITISVQMTKRYNSMDIFFTRSTVILMVIFSVTIILPLLMIETGFYLPNLINTLFIFSILSLIPFLKNISFKLKFEIGLQNLKEEICEAIDLNYDASAANKIKELCSLGLATIKENKIDILNNLIKSLDDIVLITVQEMEEIQIFNESHNTSRKSFELIKTYNAIGEELINLIFSASEEVDRKTLKDMLNVYGSYIVHNDGSYGIKRQQELLKSVGIKFIKYKLDDELIVEIIRFFYSILESDSEFGYIRRNSIQYISELCEEFFKEDLKIPFKKAVLYLWYSGANAQYVYIEIGQQDDEISKQYKKAERIFKNIEFTFSQLYLVEKLVGKKEFENIFDESYQYEEFPGLLEALKEFKSLYDDPYRRERYAK